MGAATLVTCKKLTNQMAKQKLPQLIVCILRFLKGPLKDNTFKGCTHFRQWEGEAFVVYRRCVAAVLLTNQPTNAETFVVCNI